jgi:putative glycerol-1-phosphate prenyltransferase
MILSRINKTLQYKKLFALLIDPEEYDKRSLTKIINIANISEIDFILVGGSYISSIEKFEETIQFIKANSDIITILFPGNYMQVSGNADGILLLSLISGRNPDYLIGHHVLAAQKIKNSKLEVIPTGYILIENGKTTSVEYISNTKPIPKDKHEIIVSTAIAGELMGNKLIYLEAGSGAINPIRSEIIRKVKQSINVPLIVGGGITDKETVKEIYRAGADIVVVGNAIEKQPELLATLSLSFR